MTRLGPMSTGCCVRSIAHNAVTCGPHTNHNQTRKMTNIKPFGISIFKQVKSQRTGDQTYFVSTSKRECQIIDFGIPGDQNIAIKEQEKIDQYQELRIELQKVWNVKVVVIPVVIGALATMFKKIHHYIKQTDIRQTQYPSKKQISQEQPISYKECQAFKKLGRFQMSCHISWKSHQSQ